MNLQNNAGYTAVMLASLTAPDGPGGMEVVRKLMELGNIHIRSKQVTQALSTCLFFPRLHKCLEWPSKVNLKSVKF